MLSNKTFFGRIVKGFDFLGYHFCPGRLTVAAKTLANFVARVHQLYEREREKPFGSSTLGAYVRRWVHAGLSCATPIHASLDATRTCPA